MTPHELPELLPLPEWCLDDDRAAYVLAGMSGPQYRNDMHQYARDCIAALAGAGAVAWADPRDLAKLPRKVLLQAAPTKRRNAALFTHPAPVAGGVDEVCDWTLDDSPMHTIWETACGQSWCFMTDGPEENNYRFCHGCGKPVNAILPDTAALEAKK